MTAIHVPQTVIGAITAKAKNQGISFRVTTGELSDDDKLEFMKLQDQVCDMIITPVDTEAQTIKEVKSEVDSKPPSQRLRGVMYVLWTQNPGTYKTFNSYYEAKMENLIETLKGRIR